MAYLDEKQSFAVDCLGYELNEWLGYTKDEQKEILRDYICNECGKLPTEGVCFYCKKD